MNKEVLKKLRALIVASVMLATPVAHGECNDCKDEKGNQTSIMSLEKNIGSYDDKSILDESMIDDFLVSQNEEYKMTLLDYANLVKFGYDYLNSFECFNYGDIKRDLQCLVYLVNSDYIDSDTRNVLIEKGYISNEYAENYFGALNIINCCNVYNQKRVRDDYQANGQVNRDKIIDLGMICFNPNAKKLLSNILENYIRAYESGRFPNKSFDIVFDQLTNVTNSCYGSVYQLTVGERWLAQATVGVDVIRMLKDDLRKDFTNMELSKYFNIEDLNNEQWNTIEGIIFSDECLSELELEISKLGQAREFFVKKLNNDLNSVEEGCLKH